MSSLKLERLNLLFGGDPKANASTVARRLGVSASGLSRYRSGKREPSLHVFREMCLAFGVSADWLLGIENQDGDRSPPGVLLSPEQIRCLEAGVKTLVRLTLVAGADPLPDEMTAPERSETATEPVPDFPPSDTPNEVAEPARQARSPRPLSPTLAGTT